ncbi:MAG: NADH-quinone oxidoreductase subunit L [Chloroflexi bacterium]|nr:NADH-quinone oxidoreductase subunit L [Chloroflexota bacterium]
MFNLAYLVVLFPIAAFTLIVFVTRKYHRLSAWTAIAGIFGALAIAYGILLEALPQGAELLKHAFIAKINWLPLGQSSFTMGWLIDPLSVVTLAMVTTTCLMIFIYSIGYMRTHGEDDPRYARFFAYISLFATGMLGLVISSNLLQFFVFWEIMGLCSYLLIGFWSIRDAHEHHIDDAQVVRATNASKKAFLTTRIGDVLFFVGMIWIYIKVGTLDFDKIFDAKNLALLGNDITTLGLPAAAVIGFLLLGGTIGKSAQFPLHVWLPDAMEGPTPVSALIHAATMVAAGVYLIARMFPLFESPAAAPALAAVAMVGAFTALFAATIGLAQDDIKRVLAYSTISQLGYMVAALGIAAYAAGTFHLITHAFFKALLFLSAGSVIHGIGTNDMMKMGGLRKKMGITTIVFIIGAFALMGLPPFAGFWSKDEILAAAFEKLQRGDLSRARIARGDVDSARDPRAVRDVDRICRRAIFRRGLSSFCRGRKTRIQFYRGGNFRRRRGRGVGTRMVVVRFASVESGRARSVESFARACLDFVAQQIFRGRNLFRHDCACDDCVRRAQCRAG